MGVVKVAATGSEVNVISKSDPEIDSKLTLGILGLGGKQYHTHGLKLLCSL